MIVRGPILPRLALLAGLGGGLFGLGDGLVALPALAADDAGTAPSLPAHEMGGNDAKPGVFDRGSANGGPSGTGAQTVPAPGKAAGASYPDAPPVPASK